MRLNHNRHIFGKGRQTTSYLSQVIMSVWSESILTLVPFVQEKDKIAGLCLVRLHFLKITNERTAWGWWYGWCCMSSEEPATKPTAKPAATSGFTCLLRLYLTGQGGDSVFFQAPDPLVAADRFRRQGLRALNPAYLAAIGRWTRQSAWTVGRLALRGRPATGSGSRHRWLDDASELPPGKRGQVERFVNCQLFWTDCLRARQAPLLNPLLSQPVVEHCLGVPSYRLTLGERDRGLARYAFADRLPPAIAERRDKGDLSHFYGQVVRGSAPILSGFLLDGRLVAHGVLDRAALETDLDPARLLWREGANAPLLAAVLEAWARHWEGRIARRRTEVARQPVQDVGV